jgi:hypothetical protein
MPQSDSTIVIGTFAFNALSGSLSNLPPSSMPSRTLSPKDAIEKMQQSYRVQTIGDLPDSTPHMCALEDE